MDALFFNPPLKENYLGHQIAEIYKDAIYDPFLQDKKYLTILDIGANLGVFSYYASQFAKQIYALEPAQEHFEVFKHMLEFNKLSNVFPFQIALSHIDGELDFYHRPGNKTMWSLKPDMIDPAAPVERVRGIRLDTFLTEQKIDHVDFMKLDIEGGEAEVFGGEGFRLASPKIDMIVFEVHSWVGRNPNQVIDSLRLNGFEVKQIPNEATLFVAKKV